MLEEIEILCLVAHIFGSRMFVFTGRRSRMDNPLITEYDQNPTNRSGVSEGHIHIVACRAVAMQLQRDKQIYQSRF
jgi:hypothetical protein